MLGYTGGYDITHLWNNKRIWFSNTSRMTKTSDGLDTQNSNNWLVPSGKFVTLYYDFFDYSGDTSNYVNELGNTVLLHEDFTVSIIDQATGLYPDWIANFTTYGSSGGMGSNTIEDLYGSPPCCPGESALGTRALTWLIELKMNWLQDVDTLDRTLEITFTHNDSGESVVHTLTQDGSLAANKTPLNLQVANFERPTVDASSGVVTLTFDKINTFAAFREPGQDSSSYLNSHYEGLIPSPDFSVNIIDPETGAPADWVTFREPFVKNNCTKTSCAYNFILDFEANTTGVNRYFELTITELNHNESINPSTTLPYIISGDNSFGASTFQPNR